MKKKKIIFYLKKWGGGGEMFSLKIFFWDWGEILAIPES